MNPARRLDEAWRDPAQITSLWQDASATDPRLLKSRARGVFWETLEKARITLLVTREYEHLVLGLTVRAGRPLMTFLPLPHPSGLAVDIPRGLVHLASTRNPNQVLELAPATRRGVVPERPLLPVRSRFLPGSLYLHDLALVGGALHGNAVGQNAVVRLEREAPFERVWWPRSIETKSGPLFGRNVLQLNSIAAGRTLEASFFTASVEAPSNRRPGHRNFPVDRRGVVFSGETREPVARGLTRPHSARQHEGRLFVDDSGYGDLVVIEDGRPRTVVRLPGWTRGLSFHGEIAFVGTSRVLPRFSRYAPGLDLSRSVCAVHAVDLRSGRVLGSLEWPGGNQIFAVEWLDRTFSEGLPFPVGRRPGPRERDLFYAFEAEGA